MKTSKFMLIIAAILGISGVALGAFGAHALKEALEQSGHVETWKTGVDYQFFHALALLALSGLVAQLNLKRGRSITICWLLGILLFSGSIYGLSLEGPRWLGPITPIGGLLLMAGWLLLIIDGFKIGRADGSLGD